MAKSEYGFAPTADLIIEHARITNPAALASFDPNKERNTAAYERPPRFCNLPDYEQKAVFFDEIPSLSGMCRIIRERHVKNIVVLTGAGIRYFYSFHFRFTNDDVILRVV